MTGTAEQADLPERIGQRYRVVRALGRGGMASVYECVDELTGHALAVKQLHPHLAAADGHLARLFELEFHTLTQLAHPRVVAVYDYQNQSGGTFYTMELLDGGDLHEQQALPWKTVCALLCDVCSALSLLHSRRFVHRDVTPRNIRRTRDGKAKLIDFGAMAPFGTHKHQVGTPAFTAPEAANGQPLDGRADLFSLGATAYYALTGRHAYPGRSFAGMRNVWRTQPAAPSRHAPDIPPDLDQLVMSLLSLSPGRRPASAAAVIERLTAIAGLQVEEQLLVQRSFLSTPSLVGRDAILPQIRRHMIQAARGRGTALFLTGPRGVGRSRMVDACALEGKLASATVLRADAGDAQDGDWGGVRALLEQLLIELPGQALQVIAHHAAHLTHVWPRASELTGVAALPPLQAQGVRAAVHGALLRLMEEVTRHTLLVVTADDLDLVDEPTRAFITLLAQQVSGRRMVVVAAASSEAVAAGIRGLQLLQRDEATIALQPLSSSESERLLISMFGDVPNVRLLANHLYNVSNGMPAATMQLCQHLLDRDVIQFRDGAWLMPNAIDRDVVPSSVAAAQRARIASLDATSRSLGQAIALCDLRSLTLDECRLLMAEADRPALLRCLDALAAAEVVRSFGDHYALSQPAWAPLLLHDLAPQHARPLHALIAAMLAPQPNSEFRAAGHLFACGQSREAIELIVLRLETTGKILSDEPARLPEHIQSLPSDWMQTIEMAVNEAKRLGLPRRLRLGLQSLWLQRLSMTTRPRCDVAREVVDQLYADSGLRDYAELSATCPPEALLSQAIARAQVRYDATPEAERGWSPGEAIPQLARLYVHLIGMVGASADLAFLRSLPSLEPFGVLSPAIRIVQGNVESTCHLFAGRLEQAHAGYVQILANLDDAANSGLSPSVHRYMMLAVLYAIAVQETMGGRSTVAERVSILERDPLFEVNAWRLRALWSLRQGDTEGAEFYARKAEMLRIRNAPSQFFEGTEAWYQALVFADIGDVARLRSTLDRLDAMAALAPRWSSAPLFARGQIQLLRGDAAGAIEKFSAALALGGAGELAAWVWNASGLLDALADAGRAQEAREHGKRFLRESASAGLTLSGTQLYLAMAKAELAAGDLTAALAQLQSIEVLRERWPIGDVFIGRCHELRARIAIAAADEPAFERAAQQCDEVFTRSRNAILIGRCQRLQQEAERAGMRTTRAVTRTPANDDTVSLVAERRRKGPLDIDLSECDGPESRMRKVFALVAERASVRHMILYLLRDKLPMRVAATDNCPATASIDALVSEFLTDELELSSGIEIDPEDVMTTTVDNQAWIGPTGVQFVPALLSHTSRKRQAVTGVLVFDMQGHTHPSDAILSALSAALTAANDVVPLLIEPAAVDAVPARSAKAR